MRQLSFAIFSSSTLSADCRAHFQVEFRTIDGWAAWALTETRPGILGRDVINLHRVVEWAWNRVESMHITHPSNKQSSTASTNTSRPTAPVNSNSSASSSLMAPPGCGGAVNMTASEAFMSAVTHEGLLPEDAVHLKVMGVTSWEEMGAVREEDLISISTPLFTRRRILKHISDRIVK